MPKLTQKDLLYIFDELKKVVAPYQKGHMKPRIDIQGKYDLWVEKPVVVEGRKMDAVFFCGLTLQSSYVGFYFMPVYACPPLKKDIHPALLQCLKGKSCFHIKTADGEMTEHIKDALEKGFAVFRKLADE